MTIAPPLAITGPRKFALGELKNRLWSNRAIGTSQ